MRATENAPRDPSCVLACRHGLAEIVERGAGAFVKLRTPRFTFWCLYVTMRLAALAGVTLVRAASDDETKGGRYAHFNGMFFMVVFVPPLRFTG